MLTFVGCTSSLTAHILCNLLSRSLELLLHHHWTTALPKETMIYAMQWMNDESNQKYEDYENTNDTETWNRSDTITVHLPAICCGFPVSAFSLLFPSEKESIFFFPCSNFTFTSSEKQHWQITHFLQTWERSEITPPSLRRYAIQQNELSFSKETMGVSRYAADIAPMSVLLKLWIGIFCGSGPKFRA